MPDKGSLLRTDIWVVSGREGERLREREGKRKGEGRRERGGEKRDKERRGAREEGLETEM